jgi:hypothetical protein
MKLWIASAGTLLIAGTLMAGPLKGHKNLDVAHNKIKAAIAAMVDAQKANHYDLAGHAAKAEALLRQAESEITQAAEAANAAK